MDGITPAALMLILAHVKKAPRRRGGEFPAAVAFSLDWLTSLNYWLGVSKG